MISRIGNSNNRNRHKQAFSRYHVIAWKDVGKKQTTTKKITTKKQSRRTIYIYEIAF